MRGLIKKTKNLLKNNHASKSAIFSLILVNLLSIVFAVYEHWQLGEVVLFFWAQNIIIGIFAVYKLLTFKNILFSDKSSKKLEVFAFSFLFFSFNLIYLFFFNDFIDFGSVFVSILLPLGIFLIHHIISLLKNRKEDSTKLLNIKEFASLTFIRILPLHIFLIFGAPLAIGIFFILFLFNLFLKPPIVLEEIFLTIMLIFFMLLKAFFELIAHIISHADQNYFHKS